MPSYKPLGSAKCSRCGGTHKMMRSPTGAIVADACGTKRKPPPPPDHPGLAKVRPSGKHRCVLGHNHDSAGEASCCPFVYEEAKKARLVVYRPGRPGHPCFSLLPDASTGRPVYVSVDWLLTGHDHKPVLALDYKGRVAKSKRRDKGWARGRRIFETELGIRVIELKDWTEVRAAIAALNQSARAEGGS
jgi:hypothetical protein